MNELRKKIEEQIVNPAGHLRRSFTIVAKVIKSDERNNLCSVSFIDKDGYKSNKDNVQVKIYNIAIIDWFPKVGELVNVEQNGDLLVVVSKYEGSYATDIRPRTEKKKDILSDTCTDTMAGFIF
jgi:hypothetical protein